jgi:bifunctional DNA-binding transcriptional regulator/antitoxin component of YhaV-PrlF toxin-antitoxin module
MKTTVSAKQQVSLPKQICVSLDIRPGTQIVWETAGNKIIGHPLPPEGWRSLIGKHKTGRSLASQLRSQRKQDRAHENANLAR